MRVIAGKCRSLPLQSVPGKNTRPTTDRIKETLFNLIQTYVPEACVLDLFAGSGALGIEALSRGAEYAVFVDADRKACEVIKANLAFTHLEDQSSVVQGHSPDVLHRPALMKKRFDLVFLDPPYGKSLEQEALLALGESDLVTADTLYVIEAELSTSFSWLQESGFRCIKEKVYKTNKHLLIRKEEMESS